MSTKYHISSTTQRPNICRAQSPESCPLKSDDGTPPPHFETKEEARAYVEKSNEEKYGDVPAAASSRNSENSESSSENKNLEKVETKASSLRAGDVLSGQKFVNGEWKDDDARIVRVSNEMNLDGREVVNVTYENGNTAVYNSNGRVTVKRDPFNEQGYKFTARESDRMTRSVYKNVMRDGTITENEMNESLNNIRESEPSELTGVYARKISEKLKENGMNHEATMFAAEATKIKMKRDLNYNFNEKDAYNIIYSNAARDDYSNKSVLRQDIDLRSQYPREARIASLDLGEYNYQKEMEQEQRGYRYTASAAENISMDAYRDLKNGRMDERESQRVLEKLRDSEPSSTAAVYSGMIAQKLEDENRHHEATLFKAQGIKTTMKTNLNYQLKKSDAYDLLYSANIEGNYSEENASLRKQFPREAKLADDRAKFHFTNR